MAGKAHPLGEAVERHARGRGTAEALVTPAGRFTYEDIYLRSRSAATTMHTLGIRRGDHVGILMGNDEKWHARFYGSAPIAAVSRPAETRLKASDNDFFPQPAGCKTLFYVPPVPSMPFRPLL